MVHCVGKITPPPHFSQCSSHTVLSSISWWYHRPLHLYDFAFTTETLTSLFHSFFLLWSIWGNISYLCWNVTIYCEICPIPYNQVTELYSVLKALCSYNKILVVLHDCWYTCLLHMSPVIGGSMSYSSLQIGTLSMSVTVITIFMNCP